MAEVKEGLIERITEAAKRLGESISPLLKTIAPSLPPDVSAITVDGTLYLVPPGKDVFFVKKELGGDITIKKIAEAKMSEVIA